MPDLSSFFILRKVVELYSTVYINAHWFKGGSHFALHLITKGGKDGLLMCFALFYLFIYFGALGQLEFLMAGFEFNFAESENDADSSS